VTNGDNIGATPPGESKPAAAPPRAPLAGAERAAPGAAAIALPRRVAWILVAIDALGLVAFLNLAHWLRLDIAPGITPGMIVPLGLLLLCMYVLDAYVLERQVSGMRPPARAMFGVGVAGVLTGATAYAGAFWGSDPTFGRGVFPVAFAAQALWSPLWRLGLAGWLRQQSQRIRWLVIGCGEPAASLYEDFVRSGMQGEMMFIRDDESPQGESTLLASLGGLEDLERIGAGPWSGVIVATAEPVPESLVYRLMALRFRGVRVYGLADFYEQLWFKVPVLHTRGGWLVFAHGFDLLHNPLGLRIKRLVDIALAMSLLILASPLMLSIALLVKLESRGPAIFRQDRTGLDGHEFKILKFRSMTHDAERDGPQWTQKSDPRVTRLGRWMRLLHLDELPQLVNVLRGEMSFIGPRPERPVFNAMLEEKIPLYNLRHLVRPGITGWAQVMYPYGASVEDAREKLQYDLYYIKNYSVLLDIGIMFKTLRVVVLGKGR
jgi:exopolysaccharide biosynthesis polyprenyl glycosylphosphotransferase